MNLPAKEVGHRGDLSRRLGTTLDPLPLDVIGGMRRMGATHIEVANLRMIGLRDLLFAIHDMRQAEFHVRLAGADPDLADEDVPQGDGIRPLDGDRVGPTGLGSLEGRLPFAVFVSCGCCGKRPLP